MTQNISRNWFVFHKKCCSDDSSSTLHFIRFFLPLFKPFLFPITSPFFPPRSLSFVQGFFVGTVPDPPSLNDNLRAMKRSHSALEKKKSSIVKSGCGGHGNMSNYQWLHVSHKKGQQLTSMCCMLGFHWCISSTLTNRMSYSSSTLASRTASSLKTFLAPGSTLLRITSPSL